MNIISVFWLGKAEHIALEGTHSFNDVLKALFDEGGMILVDYKLEFGLFNGEIHLGDEFSPDGCRLWDKETRRKLDKDRFRQGLGSVVESYKEIAKRIGLDLEQPFE